MNDLFTVATWNVNSVRARKEQLIDWLAKHSPDVLCLQELKTTDENFPFEELESDGYRAVTNGQKTYNGVAIISKQPVTDVIRGIDGYDDPQARAIAGRVNEIDVISAYFPNGSEPESDKYRYKKEWLEKFTDWLKTRYAERDKVIICGDFNMTPEDIDTHDPSVWEGTVISNPEMREAFAGLKIIGFEDVFRKLNPDVQNFSWWDYRAAGFRRNSGLRLDYIMATKTLADRAASATIDRNQRAVERPSDHAPVIAEFRPGH